MMEYIGATGVPVMFESVPIENDIDFHFILSFAIDAIPSGKHRMAYFQSVEAIKTAHPNVKALASLSGWSIGEKVLRWYNPRKPNIWIANAFSSLRSIITQYHLNGIDIDYVNFPKHNSTFAYCIGELITLLKNQSVITVATIAPFYSLATVNPYLDLYNRYGDVIDYVNYQFYTDKVKTADGYLRTGCIFDALKLLETNGFDVNGVMIFSADVAASNGYYYV
ncbi:hypothetical protein MKX01_029611 [Papaver californicum]|nr:hypothetical protein MKX01_029611 [Papaver californicum]